MDIKNYERAGKVIEKIKSIEEKIKAWNCGSNDFDMIAETLIPGFSGGQQQTIPKEVRSVIKGVCLAEYHRQLTQLVNELKAL